MMNENCKDPTKRNVRNTKKHARKATGLVALLDMESPSETLNCCFFLEFVLFLCVSLKEQYL